MSERRSRSEGEGASPKETRPSSPPHPRLPPRRADDEVVASLSPRAGRGDPHTFTPARDSAGGMAQKKPQKGDAGRRETH
ncbi:hypothetical protein FV220_03655 [Methylobacterium sp. WL19]|nr:hypothetical protein FV220_03655 [Methylobacterium sp. WL19]